MEISLSLSLSLSLFLSQGRVFPLSKIARFAQWFFYVYGLSIACLEFRVWWFIISRYHKIQLRNENGLVYQPNQAWHEFSNQYVYLSVHDKINRLHFILNALKFFLDKNIYFTQTSAHDVHFKFELLVTDS